ncbi:MAG: hypothetical protein AVDCRST_MAG19-4620 [uncultured Thermomicrobiales bacterium]|uniref:Uncharacterized protein n=1 Tax=uncultured Thermomicrobiales bacterium TaxID=1645740 RepID=A0A6J4VRG6_9BACT|nr:MAG: hypothetical protein AVDCRST_MAG19-4620 [uncultured Thermomicrobiales bacterium]
MGGAAAGGPLRRPADFPRRATTVPAAVEARAPSSLLPALP